MLIAVFLLFIVLALVGFGLFRGGLRGTRRGNVPHCAECDYNLIALQSERCPECGTQLHRAAAIVWGERVRRPGLMAIGLVMMLMAVLVAIGVGPRGKRGSKWYQLKPTGWVLKDAQAGDPVQRSKAFAELSRRQKAGRLSAKETGQLADALLAALRTLTSTGNLELYTLRGLRGLLEAQCLPPDKTQTVIETLLTMHAARATPKGLALRLAETLQKLNEAKCLSTEQWQRYLHNAQLISLHVRPAVIAGRAIPIEVRARLRLDIPLFCSGAPYEIRLDGEIVPVDMHGWDKVGSTVTLTRSATLPAVAPGRHVLACAVAATTRRFDTATKQFQPEPLGSRDLTLTTEFEVLESKPDGHIELTARPDLEAAVTECFAVRGTFVSVRADRSDPRGVCPTLNGWIDVTGSLPVDVAFDVMAVFDDRRAHLGHITAGRGDYRIPPLALRFKGDIPFDTPAVVDILLSPSEDAAMETVDLFKIWGGEVRFQNIEVSNHEYLEQLRELRERRERGRAAP